MLCCWGVQDEYSYCRCCMHFHSIFCKTLHEVTCNSDICCTLSLLAWLPWLMKQIDFICVVLTRWPRQVQPHSLMRAYSLTIFCKTLHEATSNSDICCTLCACLATMTDEIDRFYLCYVAKVSKMSAATVSVMCILTGHFEENFEWINPQQWHLQYSLCLLGYLDWWPR